MKKKKYTLIILSLFILIVALFTGIYAKKYYDYIFAPNTAFTDKEIFVCIPTGSTYNNLIEILENNRYIDNIESFEYTAKLKKFTTQPIAGRYKISAGMSNNEMINLFRSGKQTPVNISFISLRSLEILAGKISKFIEADSLSLITTFQNKDLQAKYGFNNKNFMLMFIPNTYEFYWNTNAEKFTQKMFDEYNKFWNEERKTKAKNISLSQIEVGILASIVEAETQKNDEKPKIAGVYINRLNKDMLLQADPSVVFANGDFSIKRILNKHLQTNSEYNTYLYKGLPPGPINIPSISSINAVLDYEKHNYLYFCAKDDFSGYHTFAITNAQHSINAKKYHKALTNNKIR